MGKIKKILENELIGGTQSTDVYPVTSTQAVYDENNRRLSDFVFDKNDIVNDLTTGGADKALSAEMGKELGNKISKNSEISDKVDNAFFWMRDGTIQSTIGNEYHVLVYQLKAGHEYSFIPTGELYPLTTSNFGIIAYVDAEELSAGNVYSSIVNADNLKEIILSPVTDCYIAVQCRYINKPLYRVGEIKYITYEDVEKKLDKSTYECPKNKEIIPVEGKVDETFALGDSYTQYNVGQTYRNKSNESVMFNSIKHRLVASSDNDIIRVFKVSSSLWIGNAYATATYSNPEFTKIYEKTFSDTNLGFKEIILAENIILEPNESIFVVLFGNSKTSVTRTSTYSTDRNFGYPIVYGLSSDIEGASVKISYGWNEYSCYPMILTYVNPYFLKKDADIIEENLNNLNKNIFQDGKQTNTVEQTGGFTTLLENVSVEKNVPYRIKVSALGGPGQIQIQFKYDDGQYIVIDDNDNFTGFEGIFTPSQAASNGCFQVWAPNKWQSFSIEFQKEGDISLFESIKNSRIREVVRVLSTDTELEVFNKMLLAFAKGNCDVIFDCSTYTFSEIYIYMRDTLRWKWTMGLPIGNGCRYFFNGSTLISNAPIGDYTESRNVLDCKSIGTDYELHDATLINNGGTYCIHDEAASDQRSYKHLYHNIIFNIDGATSCFGCGLGYKSVIEFDGCIFLADEAGAVHGPNPNQGSVSFTIVIKNSYFNNNSIYLTSLLDKTRDNLKIIFCNNSCKRLPEVDFNMTKIFNNEVRQ